MTGNTDPVALPSAWKERTFDLVDRLTTTRRGQRLVTKVVEVGLTSLGAGNHDYSGNRTGENRLLGAVSEVLPAVAAIDVGANHGSWTFEMLARIPTARVVAIEPGSYALAVLRERLASDERVVVLSVALGDRCDDVELYGAGQADDLASVNPDVLDRTTFAQLHRSAGSETVRMLTVDALLDELAEKSAIDLEGQHVVVKVDTEGLEFQIVRQFMRSRLRRDIQVLQFEFNMHALAQGELVDDFGSLLEPDFDFFRLAPRCLIPRDELGSNLANYFGFSNWVAVRKDLSSRLAEAYTRQHGSMHRSSAHTR
jgi:FkbM family methyltransferase